MNQSRGTGELTDLGRELLASANDASGYAYCGYSNGIRLAADRLEQQGFGAVGENNCGPIFRINDAGRAALTKQQESETNL